jgi:hypothetical protein
MASIKLDNKYFAKNNNHFINSQNIHSINNKNENNDKGGISESRIANKNPNIQQ